MDLQSFSRHAGKGFGLCADAGGPIPQQWGLVHLEVPSATSFVTPCPPLPLSDGTLLTKNEIIGHPTYPPPINGIIPDYQQSTYVCSYAPPADPLPVFTPLLTKGEKRQSEGGTPMCGFGNPCNPVTGNKFQKETDYEAVLTFERYFNSQQIYPITTVMGPGWSHNFSGRAFPFTWEGERTHPLAAWIDVLRPDGRLDRMHRRGGSTDTFLSSSDASLRLRLEGTGDGSQWVMHLGSGAREIYHRKGHLLSLIDPAGRATTLHYAGTIQTVVPGYLRPHNNDDMVRNVPKLVEVQGPFGHSLRFFYKDNRRLDYILDPANSRVSYSYDSAGRLSQATYQDGTSRKYDYDDPFDSTNLTGITNERGNLQSHFAYERDDRAILTEHATLPGRTAGQGRYTFSYDEDSSEPFTTTTVTNALGHPHVLTFPRRNGRRSPTHQLLPGGEERSVDTYDARNRPGIITDERGIRTGHTYGPEHLIAVVQALGTAQERTTTYTYLNNLSDLIKTKTEPSVAGAEYTKVTTTDYTPDPDQAGEYLPLASAVRVAGFTPNGTAVSRQHAFSWERVDLIGGPSHQAYFLTQIDGPQAGTTDQSTFAYYAHCPPPALVEHCARLGQPKSITRHNAPGMTITTYFDHYDVHGRLAQETDATGTITQYRYDLRGRLIERTKTGITGLILTTTYEYAPTGSLERINLADGTALHYHYDGAEQLAALSNDAGERTQFEYDLVGDQVKQQTLDSNANVTQVSDRIFDERRRLIATGQRLSSITRFIYDAAGNPTLVTDPNGNSTQLDYDALGRLAFTTDPLGGVTQTQYDIGDRESVVTDALGRETHYLYDDLGNSLETRSPDTGTTSRSFDAAGNLIHARDADGVESNYSYDALDRMTAARYSDPTHDFTLHYDDPAVNGQGRLTGINDESSTTNYAYDQHRRLTQTTQTVAGVGSTLSIVPDEIGRPAQVTYPSGVTISYTRDNIGRVLGLTLTQPGQADKPLVHSVSYLPFGPATEWTLGNGVVTRRAYDTQYRLESIDIGDVMHWQFDLDKAHNVVSVNHANVSNESQQFDYDALNRLRSARGPFGQREYELDALGNRLELTFTGTGQDLLPVGNASNRILEYDERKRLRRVSEHGDTLATYQYSAAGQRVAKSSTATTLYHYAPSGRLIAELSESGTVTREYVYLHGEPLALLDHRGASTDIYYYHVNHIATPQALTDHSQSIVWKANYTPYGSADITVETITNNLRFPGQYFDAETGLHYNYFRDYDPAVGRYIESDPIGLAGGMNTYGYVGGNPVTDFDVDGLRVIARKPSLWNQYQNAQRGVYSGPGAQGTAAKDYGEIKNGDRRLRRDPTGAPTDSSQFQGQKSANPDRSGLGLFCALANLVGPFCPPRPVCIDWECSVLPEKLMCPRNVKTTKGPFVSSLSWSPALDPTCKCIRKIWKDW